MPERPILYIEFTDSEGDVGRFVPLSFGPLRRQLVVGRFASLSFARAQVPCDWCDKPFREGYTGGAGGAHADFQVCGDCMNDALHAGTARFVRAN